MASKYSRKQLVDWFRGYAKTAAGIRKHITRGNPERYRTSVAIGKLYFFYYDPKHKDTLPIYDRFPLVIPIEFVPKYGAFLGLNLHYLTINQRAALLGQLMRFANNQQMNETTRLAVTYDLLSSTKRMKNLSDKCIKMYLRGHVRSRFIEITADEWDKVIELPVEDFVRK